MIIWYAQVQIVLSLTLSLSLSVVCLTWFFCFKFLRAAAGYSSILFYWMNACVRVFIPMTITGVWWQVKEKNRKESTNQNDKYTDKHTDRQTAKFAEKKRADNKQICFYFYFYLFICKFIMSKSKSKSKSVSRQRNCSGQNYSTILLGVYI